MNPVWTPEIEVNEEKARRIIAAQFPQFAGATVRRVGSGWDNAAFLVDERFVFRFPQRAIAAPLIEREMEFMPSIAERLAIAVPNPVYAGVPQFDYPWRFAGYEVLQGETACGKTLTLQQRRRLAEDLARFLRALHDIDLGSLHAELPPDRIGKLDPLRLKVDEEAPTGKHVVVHGDLYARHLLLDDENALCGVIDWGDLHCGHPAVDLSVVHMMVPPRDHAIFLDAYGNVDERTWRFARHRARYHANMVLNYSSSIGDDALQAAARTALRFIDA
ncbi:MAG: phosphotransferase [Candidatus Eremiobacteraeota bacterium]|nr:phosphotransferase [Candidatus Eremiobacteraeota bacterium]